MTLNSMDFIRKYNVDLFFINAFLAIKLWLKVHLFPKSISYERKDSQRKGWELTFQDYFHTLDKTKWSTESYVGIPFAGEVLDEFKDQYGALTCIDNDCVKINDNGLNLLCKKEDVIVTKDMVPDWYEFGDQIKIPFKVGQIQSSQTFRQKYGRFETRCMIPGGKGMWCAFWLIGLETYPPEVDIFETYTSKKLNYFEITHWWNTDKNRKKKTQGIRIDKMQEKMCTYAVEWYPDKMKYFWNDMLVYVQRKGVGKEYVNGIGNQELFIILGTGVQPEVLKDMSGVQLPNAMLVDYVRVYKQK